MKTYILLFRGINVGGHNILPMKDLINIFQELGIQDVQTYIQSGNVVFRSEKRRDNLVQQINVAFENEFGFQPKFVLMDAERIESIVSSNPFPEAESDPKSIQVYFLEFRPENPDLDALARIKADNERFKLFNDVFYLHAPDGIGRSKLVAKLETLLRVDATGRNWRTVKKLQKMKDL